MDEQTMLQSCLKREEDGCRFLYEQYKGLVFQTVYWVNRYSVDPEEVVQETFAQVFAQIDRYQPHTHLAAWIRTIAQRQAIRMVHRNRKTQYSEIDSKIDVYTSPNQNEPSDIELRIDLQQSLNSLPPVQQETVLLRWAGDLSLNEIAQQTDCSPNTAKYRLYSAYQKLRKLLFVHEGGSQ